MSFGSRPKQCPNIQSWTNTDDLLTLAFPRAPQKRLLLYLFHLVEIRVPQNIKVVGFHSQCIVKLCEMIREEGGQRQMASSDGRVSEDQAKWKTYLLFLSPTRDNLVIRDNEIVLVRTSTDILLRTL